MKQSLNKFYAFIDQPLFGPARIALLILVVPIFLAYLFPLWNMDFEAPQYPEGLTLDIWVHTLEGGNDGQHLEEINNLNHYIGMRTINREDLRDLDWIPFALGIFIILTLRVGVIGTVRSLIDLAVMFSYFTLFALGRFVYQLYTFGHNLDPRAPIEIEPFMPVVLGSKKVANFTTHSYPGLGGIFLGVFVAGVWGLVLWHLISGRRKAVREEQGAPKATETTSEALNDSASGEPDPDT